MFKRCKIFYRLIIGLVALCTTVQAFAFFSSNSIWSAIADHYTIPSNVNQINVRRQLYFFLHSSVNIEDLTKNSEPYIDYVYQQTKKMHLPAELALLPMIESNYKPFTYSQAGAVGLWQLMPGTASGYGIDMNWWYDGRRDTLASTRVALTYLSYLHQVFNNHWLLAIAAYDAGEGTIMNAIRYNQEHHLPTDFWALPLPRETQVYVPRLLALAYIIQHPKYYHLKLADIPNQPITGTVVIHKQMDLSTIAKDANISTSTVHILNPGFRRFATPPNQTTTTLVLPTQKIHTFIDHYKNDKSVHTEWLHYNVKSGNTLGKIAHQFSTTVNALKRVNNLHGDIIHIHQDLLIPRTSKPTKYLPSQTVSRSMISEDHLPGPQRIIHTIVAGDSLWKLAKHYHVSIAQLRFWNNLTPDSPIHLGERLILWQKHTFHSPTYLTYHVKPGDTLGEIAQHYHTTTQKIKSINNLHTSLLEIEQRLMIPN